MLGGTLVSCKGNNTDGNSSDTGGESESENRYDVQDDMGELDFKGERFDILQWDAYINEWSFNSDVSSMVDSQLYARQKRVEKRLNITFNVIISTGKYEGINNFNRKIEESVTGGVRAYDLAAHYSLGAARSAINGYALNLLDTEHLNLNKEYWPAEFYNSCVVNDQLYFITGYLTPTVFENLSVVFYNQDIIDRDFLEDPVALVDSNQWTYEKMYNMSKGMYADSVSGSGKDAADTYGIVTNNRTGQVDALAVGAGIRGIDINPSTGRLELSYQATSARTASVLSQLHAYFVDSEASYMPAKDESPRAIFASGRSLFAVDRLNYQRANLTNATFTVGIVPVPKWDSDQTSFYSSLDPQHTMYTIPSDAVDGDMSSAVLEAMSSDGYQNLFPTIFEEVFKKRYSKDDNMSRMIDIVNESILFEPARAWGNLTLFWMFRAPISGGGAWSTALAGGQDGWQDEIDSLNKYLFHEN